MLRIFGWAFSDIPSRRRGLRFSDAAFTFIEVLVGTFLVLVVFSGIFGVYQLGLKVISQSKARITAVAIANQKMEMIRNLPYKEVGTIPHAIDEPEGDIPQTEYSTQNNISYTIATKIIYINDCFDGPRSGDCPLAPETDNCVKDYKRAAVKVSWQKPGQGEVALETDFAPKNLNQEEEECTGAEAGVLSVSVFNALGQAVSLPLIEIINPDTGATLTSYQPLNGKHDFVLAPNTYKIKISKPGAIPSYSAAQTYQAGEVYAGRIIAEPAKSHPAVYAGKLTETGFSIDVVSSMTVQTRGVAGQGSVPIHNVTFKMEGAKTVGNDTEGKPIYKYSQNHTVNGPAQIAISDLEWDSYSFYVDFPDYDLIEIESPFGTPATQPIDLLPNTAGEVKLILKAENTLLVTVKDTLTHQPIFGAGVRIFYNSEDYQLDITQPTDEEGKTFFFPLKAVNYNLEIQADEYETAITTVLVSGDTLKTIYLTKSGEITFDDWPFPPFNYGSLNEAVSNYTACSGTDHAGSDWTPANGSTISGDHCNVANFTIVSGYTVYISAGSSLRVFSQDANIAGILNANGKGYSADGPGVGTSGTYSGGGGGYGGAGGAGYPYQGGSRPGGISYGLLTAPTDLGSSGGAVKSPGGSGGGAVFLRISNSLSINGTITTNGTSPSDASNDHPGGGSGGSIYIIVNSLSGTGSLTANGGNGAGAKGGGGGGGRIAVYYSDSIFSGNLQAYSGTGYYPGGAGTIFYKRSGEYGKLIVKNNNINDSQYSGTPLDEVVTFDAIDLGDGGWLIFTADASNYSKANTSGNGDFTVTGQALMSFPKDSILKFNAITVSANAVLSHRSHSTSHISSLNLEAANMTITGMISLRGSGFSADGPGVGTSGTYSGGGGGYGGAGGAGYPYQGGSRPGGISYGLLTAPTDLGSSGGAVKSPGGSGGGAVFLRISNSLSINGTITTNGTSPSDASNDHPGGGSGGSIYIIVNSLSGTGSLTANGGNGAGAKGGGGGGGRIAVYYLTKTNWTGSTSVNGGSGYNNGGIGTVNMSQIAY